MRECLAELRVLYDNLNKHMAQESGKKRKDSGDSDVDAGLPAMRGQQVRDNACESQKGSHFLSTQISHKLTLTHIQEQEL